MIEIRLSQKTRDRLCRWLGHRWRHFQNGIWNCQRCHRCRYVEGSYLAPGRNRSFK